MKITVQTQQEVEVTVPPYWKNFYAYYKKLSDDTALKVWESAILVGSLSNSEIMAFEDITKEEFDAAYDRATQNIREAYLS